MGRRSTCLLFNSHTKEQSNYKRKHFQPWKSTTRSVCDSNVVILYVTQASFMLFFSQILEVNRKLNMTLKDFEKLTMQSDATKRHLGEAESKVQSLQQQVRCIILILERLV